MPIITPASGVKAGTIAHFAASSAPTGWIKANGAAVSRSDFVQLFAAIGTTYGAGDGSTTFNVPDLRGEFVRSLDDGRGVDSGRGIGTAQAHQMQSHTHTQYAEYFSLSSGGGTIMGRGVAGTGGSTSATGGTNNSSENRPRNVALLACIKF